MRRAALAATSQLDDLKISTDHHALSSDGASACFQNNNAGRNSFINTASGAAINANAFPNGFTFETFIKIDAGWTAAANQWNGAISREGVRREVANVLNPGYNYDEPTFALGVSNLREIQWNALASRRRATATASAPTGRARSSPTGGSTSPTSTTRRQDLDAVRRRRAGPAQLDRRVGLPPPTSRAHRLHQGQRLARLRR